VEILVISDDAVEEQISRSLEASPGVPWRISRSKVSDFLRANGATFSDEDGLFHHQRPAAGASASAQPIILNRVVEVSDQTLKALGGENSLLARGLVTSALDHVLSGYKKVIGTPGVCSPVGHLVPLVSQWKLIGKKVPGLRTPEYKYGYGPEPIDAAAFARPIWKSPFDFYSWKVSDTPPAVHWDSFVVNRPEGTPLLLYFFGKAWDAQLLAPGQALPEELKGRLRELVPALQETFGAFSGESLMFADGPVLTFASFSHYFSAASRQAHFQSVLLEGLAAELPLARG
jgi:hypothetical protein